MRSAMTRKVVAELSRVERWPKTIIETFVDTYLEAVTTRPLVVLFGPAGSGKTLWTAVVAQALGDPHRTVPVPSDFGSAPSILGFYDAVLRRYCRTEALNFTVEALNEFRAYGLTARRYHLCLRGLEPETALAHLAPLLRALETPERQIRLHDQRDELRVGVARSLFLPTNLVIVATLNVDNGGDLGLGGGALARLALNFPDR